MKKIFCLVVIVVMLVSCLSGCADKDDTIVVKGVYALNTDSPVEYMNSEVEEGKQYIIVVYDVLYDGVENQQVNSFDRVVFKVNNGNKYDINIGRNLDNFIKNAGYNNILYIDEILGGSENLRIVSAVQVNKNDLKDSNNYEIDFNISKDIASTLKLKYDEIKKIDLLDEIFEVEENPEAYQVARSVFTRAKISNKETGDLLNFSDVNFFRPNYNDVGFENFNSANLLIALKPFGDKEYLKMTVGTYENEDIEFNPGIKSNKIKELNLDDIKFYYPEIIDEVEILMNYYDELLNADTISVEDTVNIWIESCNAIDAILEYFES